MEENDYNKIKKKLEQIGKGSVKAILSKIKIGFIGAVIIVFLAGCQLAITVGAVEMVKNFVVGIVDSIASLFTGGDDNDNATDEKGIIITEETLDELATKIENEGFNLNELFFCGDIKDYDENSKEYKKAKYKYLKQFLLAELCTQYPDFGITPDDTHYNGIIKVRRLESTATDVSEAKNMEYISKEMFDKLVNMLNGSGETVEGYTEAEAKNKIKNLYTIDGSGNLYFVNYEEIHTEGDGATGDSYTVTTQSVNYKSAVEKYAMPIRVSLALCESTQNPQYVYEFIEKFVLSGHIDLTIMDNLYVDTYNSWYDYQLEMKTLTYELQEAYADLMTGLHKEEWSLVNTNTETVEFNDRRHYKKVVTTMQSVAQITDVDTWVAKVNITYENKQPIVEYPLGTEEIVENQNTLPEELPSGVSYDFGNTKTKIEYTFDQSKNYVHYVQNENLTYNTWERLTNETDEVASEEKAKEIIAQWDEYFKLPNSNKKNKPGSMLVNGGGDLLLLKLLDNEDTQKQREVFQYYLYLYTDKDYGVTKLDYSIYDVTNFSTMGGIYGGKSNLDGIPGQIYDFLIAKGVPPVGAAAIMGNIEGESSFNPSVVNGIGASGLAQWTEGRLNGLKSLASREGKNWTDVDVQLEYLWYELSTTYSNVKNIIMNATEEDDLEYATWYFGRHFEIFFIETKFETSKNITAKRYEFAKKWYASYQENATTDNSINNDAIKNGTIGEKAVEYAKSKIGALYWYGQAGPTYFDCSGFVSWCYNQAGANIGRKTTTTLASMGKAVAKDKSQLKVGDLIITSSHVVMYIGNGQIIGANGGSRTTKGDNPKACVSIKNVDNYFNNAVAIRRLE